MSADTPSDADTARSFVESVLTPKPQLVVYNGNLPVTTLAVRNLLASTGEFFERDMPVMIRKTAGSLLSMAVPLTVNSVTMEVHAHADVVKFGKDGVYEATLPERVGRLYLDLWDWRLPPLAGICGTPLIDDAGAIFAHEGYDPASALYCTNVPTLPVPDHPTEADARAALLMLRIAFRSFPFADAVREEDAQTGIALVDVTTSPGADESAFLTALVTAAARPSLYLAPALLISAPVISGAGNGKGLLARCISAIAFGVQPRAFGAGNNLQELDKRLAAELIGAAPVLLLDNVNATALKSETLASAITERPSSVRVMGTSKMVTINSTAFIMVTGNGLCLSEDLARRFVEIALDAGMEDPEQRPFRPGFLKSIQTRRPELLTACMTILRFGRQNATRLVTGIPLGSFETWGAWVRDPLLTLGCLDPVERLRVTKLNDPKRRQITDIFQSWWDAHRDQPTKAADLADAVRTLIDPHARGRQYVARRLQSIAGTRAAGFVLTHQPPAGKWGVSTYALKSAPQPSDPIGHRTDRAHGGCTPMPGAADACGQNGAQPTASVTGANNDASRADATATDGAGEDPMTPMGPMPDAVEGADAGIEDGNWEGEI